MNIVYDIDFLGRGHIEPENRTGIYRVAEHIAEGLALSQENVCFFAEDYITEAHAYLKHNPKLSPDLLKLNVSYLNLLTESCNRWFIHKQKAALQHHYSGKEKFELLNKVYRKILFGVHNLLPNKNGRFLTMEDKVLEEATIFHSPFSKLNEKASSLTHLSCFLTVYDLIPILFPQLVDASSTAWTQEALESLRPEDWVFAISQATKNDLCNYRKDLNPDKIIVTPLAASAEKFYPCKSAESIFRTRKKYGLPDDADYILGLSTLAPHKNFERLVRCFGKVLEQEREKNTYLVLVGTKGWNADNLIASINSESMIAEKVIFTGRVSDEDLSPLYTGALAFAYLSYYEGFGLPPLEAMQCGIPVITSNTSSLPEVVGDAGVMVSPTDEDEICQALTNIIADKSLREVMARKSLNQAARFSWEKCVQQTIDGYKQAAITKN